MGTKINCQVTGTINLKKELDNFSQRTLTKVIKLALEAVGELFKEAIKANCNFTHGYSTGAIRESIDYNTRMYPAKGRGTVLIGPTMTAAHGKDGSTSPGVYAMFVEYGLKVKKYPKQPFIRPAFDANADKAIEVFRDKVMEGISTRLPK